MPINAAKIENILQNFVSGTNDIQGTTLVSPDGLSLASVLPNAMDDEKVSAMSAAMLSLGERMSSYCHFRARPEPMFTVSCSMLSMT